LESFLRSIASLRRTDLRPMLDQIKIPAMGIYGDRDKVVHPRQWEPMKKGINHAHIERFSSAGHFPMLEEPQNFAERLKSFLDQEAPAPAEGTRTSTSLSPTPSVTL
ncbi:MAG TPA: alpha/beta hydrolase, partial [Anaerolineales bacterium]|nr:alpha/beta hydrolase [Anaerolineales bacterium]